MLTSIATFSYATATTAYLALSILLLTRWRGHVHGKALTLACLLSALWALTITYQAVTQQQQISILTDLLEILRNIGWTIFLMILLGLFRKKEHFSSYEFRPSIVVGIVLYLVFSVVSLYSHNELNVSPL